ncbi:MAG: hypothetical protein QME77_10530, partial [bacterium]|nr:hypothetical protein [bacterium]
MRWRVRAAPDPGHGDRLQQRDLVSQRNDTGAVDVAEDVDLAGRLLGHRRRVARLEGDLVAHILPQEQAVELQGLRLRGQDLLGEPADEQQHVEHPHPALEAVSAGANHLALHVDDVDQVFGHHQRLTAAQDYVGLG